LVEIPIYADLIRFDLHEWALQVFASFLRYLRPFKEKFSTKHFIYVETSKIARSYNFAMSELEEYLGMIGNYDFSILSSILITNNVFQYFRDAQFKAGIAANLKQDSDLYKESIAQLSMSNAKMTTEHSILRREYE